MNSIFLYTKTGIKYEDAVETIKKEFTKSSRIRFEETKPGEDYDACL